MIDWAVMKMRQSNRNRVVLKSPGLESLNENFLDHHRPLHRNDENDHLSSSSQKNFHERTISSSICPTIASIVWRPLWPPGWHPRSSSSSLQLQPSSSSKSPSSITTKNKFCTINSLTNTRQSDDFNLKESIPRASKSSVSIEEKSTKKVKNRSRMSKNGEDDNDDDDDDGTNQSDRIKTKTSTRKPGKHHHHHHHHNYQPQQHQHRRYSETSGSKIDTQKSFKCSPIKSSSDENVDSIGNNTDEDSGDGKADDPNLAIQSQQSFQIFQQENYLKIEDWLDEHPEFVHSYVVRKASRSVIDKWLLAHSSSTLGTTIHANSNQLQQQPIQQQQDSSGSNTPVRKISAHEFEATGGGYLRPMVTTTNDGTLTFLPVQNRPKTSQQDGVSALSSDHLKYHRSLSNELKNGTHLNRCTQRSHSPFRSAVSDTSQKLFTESSDINKKENDPNHIHHHHHHYHNHPHLASKSHPLVSIKSKEELKSILDERELIFELVKDICNDLDVKSLCHKILKNVSILINADRCSLFLVRGEKNDPDNCYLVSQLFDVDQQSTIEQVSRNGEIIIPWGTGIVGHVAESGIPANIPDCYQDSRFSDIIDHKTGYKTHDMLCNPIFDIDGEVIGVAQVINKKNSDSFDSNDENVFYKYLQFCGIGLRNAQIYERSQLENKRNQVLLDLAQMIFEKQSNIENIIYRILIHILSLLQCERCQIMLLVDDSDDPSLFYYGRSYQDPYADLNIEPNELNRSLLSQIDCGNISDSNSSCSSCNASTTSESLCDLSIGVSTNQKISPNRTTSFYRVFDLQSADMEQSDFEKTRFTPFEGRFPINIGITGYVATSGETLNIPDAYKDNRFDPSVDQDQDFRHQSILCMPIRNASRKIIGVAQLVNKLNKRPFNKNDENLFEAFAIFSGMGIENTQMFERAVKAMAKQKVTLELLSYHASANDQEASKFARMLIPSTSSLSLSSLRFDDFSLNEDQMIKACIRMFIDLDLIERFHIDYKVLCKWILTVRKNYRPVLYHNWRHAFNVAQMMFAIFVNTDMCLILGELETLSLIVACLCHDLDHRGTNNSFQIKISSPLAQLYSTSTLEHHHFDQSLMILNSQGNQILSNLSPDEYRRVVYVLEEAILATDLAVYFRKRDQFIDIVDLKNFDWSIEQHRSLLRSMLMTCCDIAAITKPWHIQKVVAELVASEFYQQGDIEKKQLNIEPIDMMNRDKKNELPRMQMSFIDSICLPIYQTFAKLCPLQMKILLNGVLANREAWNLLSNEPYRLNLRHPSTRNCDPSNKETSKQTKSIETIEDNQCAE